MLYDIISDLIWRSRPSEATGESAGEAAMRGAALREYYITYHIYNMLIHNKEVNI